MRELLAGLALVVCGTAGAFAQAPGRTYSLGDLLGMARSDNLALAAARAQSLAVRAGVTTASAYPNPELEWSGLSLRARAAGATGGSGQSLTLTQRIESPSLRGARIGAATASAQAAGIGVWVVENELVATIKTRYFETLKRQEELAAAQEELALTEQIRDRVRVRTRTGEGPRFDLVRADAEVAMAAKQVDRARALLAESRAELVQAVGVALAPDFVLEDAFYRRLPQADEAALRDAVLAANPEIKRLLAERERAERQIEVERALVLPGVGVRLGHDIEPETRATRAGVVLSVPLWDRRRGPVDEARAQAIRTRTELDLRRFDLAQGFEAALQRYRAARTSVSALEGGILEQARAVVDIAEAAYRFGERGILDYLDARRQLRAVRAELIAARFELHAAKAELERLAATDIKGD